MNFQICYNKSVKQRGIYPLGFHKIGLDKRYFMKS